MRIPLSYPVDNFPLAETLYVPKQKLSLRNFLATPCTSKIIRTSIWKTSIARKYDVSSYMKATQTRRRANVNKREKKQHFKQLRENMLKQRELQKREQLNDKFNKNKYQMVEEAPRTYSKPKEVVSDSLHLNKTNFESSTTSRFNKEESSRSFEEVELRSTAISCQEKASIKGENSKSYPEVQVSDYNLDHEISPSIHQMNEKHEREHLPSDKCLLDEMFEKQNEDMSEFMDSIPLYDV